MNVAIREQLGVRTADPQQSNPPAGQDRNTTVRHASPEPIVCWDAKFGMVKVSPLATWTRAQVWQRIHEENIPYNVLHDQGYLSIGCWPCTRPVECGEDERAGRWSGMAKTECGLHTS